MFDTITILYVFIIILIIGMNVIAIMKRGSKFSKKDVLIFHITSVFSLFLILFPKVGNSSLLDENGDLVLFLKIPIYIILFGLLCYMLFKPKENEIQDFLLKYNKGENKEDFDKKIRKIANPINGYPEDDQKIAKALLDFVEDINNKEIRGIDGGKVKLALFIKEQDTFWEKHFKDIPDSATIEDIEAKLRQIADINSNHSNLDKKLAQHALKTTNDMKTENNKL